MGDEFRENNQVTDQNEGTSDQAGGTAATGDTVVKTERVFTQDEVSRMMAREKHQGRNAVYSELGIDPDDTSAVKMFKAFVEAQKTEEQKKNELDAQRQQQMNDMNNKLKVAEAKAILMQNGVSGEYVDDAVTIVLARIANDDTLDVETAAKDLKAKYSVWFEGKAGAGNGDDKENKSTGKKGTGKAPATGSNTSSNSDKISGIGKRLAEKRKAQLPSKSYWGE